MIKNNKCPLSYWRDKEGEKEDFILFDVMVEGCYVSRGAVKEIAEYFQIKVVPVALIGTIQNGIDYVKTKPKSMIGAEISEGVVGRPLNEVNCEPKKWGSQLTSSNHHILAHLNCSTASAIFSEKIKSIDFLKFQ